MDICLIRHQKNLENLKLMALIKNKKWCYFLKIKKSCIFTLYLYDIIFYSSKKYIYITIILNRELFYSL